MGTLNCNAVLKYARVTLLVLAKFFLAISGRPNASPVVCSVIGLQPITNRRRAGIISFSAVFFPGSMISTGPVRQWFGAAQVEETTREAANMTRLLRSRLKDDEYQSE